MQPVKSFYKQNLNKAHGIFDKSREESMQHLDPDAEGKVKYCYTMNNTAIATPRILIPLIENNQQKDGTIKIPEVLVPYMGKKFIGK